MSIVHPPHGDPLNQPHFVPTLLVIEDEEDIRSLMMVALRIAGFATLGAGNGDQAIEMAASCGERIDLVVADLGAVRLTDFLTRLSTIRPGLRTLVISGLSHEHLLSTGWLSASIPFIEKPFRMSQLVTRARELIREASSQSVLEE